MLKTILRRVAPLLLAAFFSATAVFGVCAHYRFVNLLVVLALYLLLSLALYWGAGFLVHCGRAFGWSGAFLLTFIAVWHFREQTFLPGTILGALLLAALLSVPCYLLMVRLFAARRRTPYGFGFVGSALGLLVLWVGAYQTSPMLRWHLLRHNTMLGTPAYYLLDRSVLVRQEALFEAHRDPPERPPEAQLPGPAPAAVQPNLVFIMIDTLRADALAVHGGDPELMPRLNRFFNDAYRFTDVVANSSWTRSSVASFFTGLLPEEHGARLSSDPLAAARVTLAEILRGRGYHTAAFVTNLAAVGREAGFAQGFDTFHEFQEIPYARAETVKHSVLRWLSGSSKSAPRWFLYLHFLDPHVPYLSGVEPRRRRPQEYWAAYRAELGYLDQELGEILDALRRELPGPTLFFITSDHGEEFFEHELFGHGYTLYGEVVRIPAALDTGQSGGVDVMAPLEARDFFDLLLSSTASSELAIEQWARRRSRDRRYISLYHSTEGRLLLRPYLRRMCLRAVEEDGYKLVWSAYGDTYELYDLSRDPGETRNLAAVEPERVVRMAATFNSQVRFWTFPEALELDGEARERLQALGYLN